MRIAKPIVVDRARVSDIETLVALKFAMFAKSGRAHLLPVESRTIVTSDYEAMYADDNHRVNRTAGKRCLPVHVGLRPTSAAQAQR